MFRLRPAYVPAIGRAVFPTAVGADVAYTSAWTDDDLRELARIAQKYQMDPADLLLVMASESGLKPSAANPLKNSAGNPAAVGLIQFTQVANDALGITEAQRADMVNWSVADQLPLVDRYFSILPWSRAGNAYENASMVYEGVFAGGLMLSKGTSPDTVLYTEGVDGSAYSANKGFDVPDADGKRKGYITVADLGAHVERVAADPPYVEIVGRLNEVVGSGGSESGWGWLLGGLLVAGAGAYAVVR
jgi:transglycosylase-like protein with SLT domain